MGRHISKLHDHRGPGSSTDVDSLYQPVLLQSWTQANSTQVFWVVCNVDHSHPPVQNYITGASPSPVEISFLNDLRQRESRFFSVQQQQDLSTYTGNITYEGTRPWLDRTGWITAYQGVPRNILTKMIQLHCRTTMIHGFVLGCHQEQELISPAVDEARIHRLLHGVDLMLDRCEETMRHTGHPILIWLHSHQANMPSDRPFSFLATAQSRKRYRYRWKQLIVFLFRAVHLYPVASNQVLRIPFLPEHQQRLREIWDHSFEARPTTPQLSHALRCTASSYYNDHQTTDPELSEISEDDLDSDPNFDGSTSTDEDTDKDDLNSRMKIRSHPPSRANPSNLPSPQVVEMLFQLCILVITQEFRDGNPQASILVYFPGILGMSTTGQNFLPARNYTTNLSALIYIQRLLFLEYALPYRAYEFLNWSCRPEQDHLTRLEAVRRQYMLPGSLTALGEFQRLRAFGKQQALLDPPPFFLHWSPDQQTVTIQSASITMSAFRGLAQHFLQQGEQWCTALLLGLQPTIHLQDLQDCMVNRQPGQSFVTNAGNHLRERYFELAQQAVRQVQHGFMRNSMWQSDRIHQYLQQHDQLLEWIAGILITTGGQMPRLKELLSIEFENTPSTERALYVYQGQILYLIRHSKSKRSTGREFIVARFLPQRASHVLLLYLVYIRPFATLPGARNDYLLLYQSATLPATHWEMSVVRCVVSSNIHCRNKKVWGHCITPRLYRQLSIAIAEKHVQGTRWMSHLYDDHHDQAPPDAVFAWQSGHRPLVRATNYGLDGAYPTKLQPSLLALYAQASQAWHRFLYLEPGNTTKDHALKPVPIPMPNNTAAACLLNCSTKRPLLIEVQ